jgi:uncharacterized protein with FMN-binding domain
LVIILKKLKHMKKFLCYLLLLMFSILKIEGQSQSRDNLGLGTAATKSITYFLQTANNLSDVTAATARTNLSLVPGTDIQAYDADLLAIAGLTATTDNIIMSVSSAWASRTPTQVKTALGLVIGTNLQAWDADLDYLAGFTPSANVKTILNSTDFADVRTNLSLVVGTNVQAYDADLTTYAGITPSANVQTLLGAANFSAFRTSLSLVPGTDVEVHDADLTTIAGLTATTDNFLVSVASAWASRTPAQVRTTLSLVIGTNVQAYDADLDYLSTFTPSANVKTILNAADNAAVRTAISLVPGTDVEAHDADLTTIAGLTATTDNFIVSVSSAWASRTPAQVRTTLALVVGTNVEAWDADLDTWAGVTPASGVATFLATPSSANFFSMITNESGSGLVIGQTNPVLVGPTIGIAGTSASTHITTVGTAPTVAQTGLGSGGSVGVAVDAGSTDQSGTITLTTGNASVGSTGTVTLTFNGAYVTHNPVIVCTLVKGATDWGVLATVRITTESLTAPILTWNNSATGAAVALTANTTYKIHYVVIQK